MKAIAILNLKGGVGKTVTAVNMAHILASEHKQRVLLIDCDSQCNATEFFGLAPTEYDVTLDAVLLGECEPYYAENITPTSYSDLDMIPASDGLMDLDMSHIADKRVRGRVMADMCRSIREDDAYDYVIFDCPPAFNAASAAALLASDEVIIPIKLDAFSLRGLANVSRQIDNIRRINGNIRIAGALITMWRNVPVVLEAEAKLRESGVLPVFQTVTAARTFYAQFAPAEYKITWDLGTGKTETTNQTYGETLNLPTEPTRRGYAFLGWFTQETGGTQVDGNTVFKEAASTTYYAHWEEATVFSVVVPAVLPVTVDQNGKVYVSNAEIVNHSTAAVQVSSVTLTAENGWTLVPYASDMSHTKVDSNQIGFSIRDQKTTKTGDSEVFTLSSPWQIAEEESLTLTYDAVVSALSQPVTNANILCVLFVAEWA